MDIIIKAGLEHRLLEAMNKSLDIKSGWTSKK